MEHKEIEKLIKKAEKEERKRTREQRRAAKEIDKIAKANKPVKTETEIVRNYADTIMKKQATRGMLREEFKDLEKQKPNKNIWMDTDFFFSVVFQSQGQKEEFFNFLGQKYDIKTENGDYRGVIQIVNGLRLAESMGCVLKKEVANDYQTCNLELRDIILDV